MSLPTENETSSTALSFYHTQKHHAQSLRVNLLLLCGNTIPLLAQLQRSNQLDAKNRKLKLTNNGKNTHKRTQISVSRRTTTTTNREKLNKTPHNKKRSSLFGSLGIVFNLLFTFILSQLLLQRLNASLVGFNDQFQFAHIVQNGLGVEALHRDGEERGRRKKKKSKKQSYITLMCTQCSNPLVRL